MEKLSPTHKNLKLLNSLPGITQSFISSGFLAQRVHQKDHFGFSLIVQKILNDSMNAGKRCQFGKHGLGSLHNLTWACYQNEDTCFNVEFASHSQTRKHSIRMRTTRLETYVLQFRWPSPEVAPWGFSK